MAKTKCCSYEQFQKIFERIYDLVFALNQESVNSVPFSCMLILGFFSACLNTMIPKGYDLSALNQEDKYVFYPIHYINIANIFEDMKISKNAQITGAFIIHILLILFYVILYHYIGQYYKSTMIKIIAVSMSFIQEIYVWILLFPTLDICLEEVFHMGTNKVFSAIAWLTIPIALVYGIGIKYCDYEIAFMPNNGIRVRNASIYQFLIGSLIGLEVLTKIFQAYNQDSLIIIPNLLLAIMLFRSYLIDLPIQNVQISRFFACSNALFCYLVVIIDLRTHRDMHIEVFYFLILVGAIIVKLMLTLTEYLEWQQLTIKDYKSVRISRIDRLGRDIITMLTGKPKDKMKNTFKLITFIQNHKRHCKIQDCTCRQINLDNLSISKLNKLNMKNPIMTKYKTHIIYIIANMFYHKASTLKKDEQVPYLVLYSQILYFQTQDYIVNYLNITNLSFRYSVDYAYKQILRKISVGLEKKINDITQDEMDLDVKFSEIMDYYEILAQLKKNMLTNIEHYDKLFEENRQNPMDLDNIVFYSKKVAVISQKILQGIEWLFVINPKNSELRRLLELYESLETIDEESIQSIELSASQQRARNNSAKLMARAQGKQGSDRRGQKSNASNSSKWVDQTKKIPNIFDEEAVILFISLNESTLGALKRCTPNLTELFGFDTSEIGYMDVRRLMPGPFAEKHNDFLKSFLKNKEQDRLNKYLEVYGLDREQYIFSAELFIKLEVMDREIMAAGFMKQIKHDQILLMISQEGFLSNYSKTFHKALNSNMNFNNTDLYGAYLPILIPRLILFFIWNNINVLKQVFKGFFGMEKTSEYLLENETVFICFCNKLELVYNLTLKIKTLYRENYDKGFKEQEQTILSILIEFYLSLDLDDFDLFATTLNFRENPQRGDLIKVKFVEIDKMARIKNEEKKMRFIENTTKFLTILKKFHDSEYGGLNLYNKKNFEMEHQKTIRGFAPESREDFDRANSHFGRMSHQLTIHSGAFGGGGHHSHRQEDELSAPQINVDPGSTRNVESPFEALAQAGTPRPEDFMSTNNVDKESPEKKPRLGDPSNTLPQQMIPSINANMDQTNTSQMESSRVSQSNQSGHSDEFTVDNKLSNKLIQQQNIIEGEVKLQRNNSDGVSQRTQKMQPLQKQSTLDVNMHYGQLGSAGRTSMPSQFAADENTSQSPPQDEKIFVASMNTMEREQALQAYLNHQENSTDVQKLSAVYDQIDEDLVQTSNQDSQIANLDALTYKAPKRIQFMEPEDMKDKVKDREKMVVPKKVEKRNDQGINRESSVSSRSSSSLKYYKNLLKEETQPKEIDRMNVFGMAAMIIIMVLIILIYFLTIPTLNKYRNFELNGDFPSRLLAGFSIYASEVEILLALNNIYIPQNFPQSDIDELYTQSKKLMHEGYDIYKAAYAEGVVKNSPEAMGANFEFDKWSFKVKLKEGTSQSEVTMDFSHAVSRVLTYMHEVQQLPLSAITKDEKHVQYFRKNFPEYFNKLSKISHLLNDAIEGSSQAKQTKDFTIQMTAISLTIVFLFLVLIVPLYRKIDKVKETGLSKLSTIDIQDIETKIIILRRVKHMIGNQGSLDFDDCEYIQGGGDGDKKDGKNQRKHRTWKRKTQGFTVLAISLAGVFGILLTFFLLNAIATIDHSDKFVPAYVELDIISDTYAYFPSYYQYLGEELNLFQLTQAEKDDFFATRDPILEEIYNNEIRLRRFYETLDQHLENGMLSPEYRSKVEIFKHQNICTIIVNATLPEKQDCSSALNRIPTYGLVAAINSTYNIIRGYSENFKKQNFDVNFIGQVLRTNEYHGVTKMRLYLEEILLEYKNIVRRSLDRMLDLQQIESMIYMITGLVLVFVGFLIGWRWFMQRLKTEFQVVKKTFGIMPFDLIIMNNYIKKFLKDNSAKGF